MQKQIDIQSFITAYNNLDKVKYTNPPMRLAWVELANRLAVMIENGYGKNQIQKRLDEITAEMVQEMSDLSVKVGA